MITGEAIDRVANYAGKALTPQVVKIDGVEALRIVVVDGKCETITVPPPKRSHLVESVDDLARFAECHSADKPMSCWHSAKEVTLLVDDNDRRECVRMTLEQTKRWRLIKQLETGWEGLQGETIKFLRELGVEDAAYEMLRQLDWKSYCEATGEVKTGTDRMGKQISHKVTGSADLPESIPTLSAIYANNGEDQRYHVMIHVGYYPAIQRIGLWCDPDELVDITKAHQNDLHERLVAAFGDHVQVYHGTV